MAFIADLPPELLLLILSYVDQCRDLCSLSGTDRSLHWWTYSRVFEVAFNQRSVREGPELVFLRLFLHAVKHDSQNIAQWLIGHELSTMLNGTVPLSGLRNVTYLHLSIIGDAPRVAACLVKHGTDIWEGEVDYPDLTPLYLAIARPKDSMDLDGPLRIACSYALPRISRYFLTRGADPNRLSRFGLAAIHLAVMRRPHWRNFSLLPMFLGLEDNATRHTAARVRWEVMLLRTLSTLLWFGGDPNLRSATSRLHPCGHLCWRSPDCNHQGQTVLHFACGNGAEEVVELLLERGADPEVADSNGYLPLFVAICQDHNTVALRLLQCIDSPATATIVQPHQSTALHIACRFASPELVIFLLKCGADANATDQFGKTPLHEVMGQNCRDLEDRVLATLHHLADNGASPDLRKGEGKTARQMAEKHLFNRVRGLFGLAGDSDHLVLGYSTTILPSGDGGGLGDGSSRPDFMFKLPRLVRPPDSDNHGSFPPLGGRLPNQDGIEHRPPLNSVWSGTGTGHLFPPPPPPPPPQSARHPGTVHGRLLNGEIGPAALRGGGGETPIFTETLEHFQMSSAATFWSSFSPHTQEAGQRRLEPTSEQQGGVTRRGKRKKKQKWTTLELP